LPVLNDGTVTPGSPTLARAWLFAEGSTLPGFDTFFTILNPGAAQTATVTYFTDEPADGPIARTVNLPASSRVTVQMFAPAGQGGLGLVRTGVASSVAAPNPILVERPLFAAARVGDLDVAGGTDVV